jgi:sulfur carrier protein ThiS
MEVSNGTTIRGLLKQLKVPKKQIKVIFLNGIHAKDGDILKEGDRVGIFPAVAGG